MSTHTLSKTITLTDKENNFFHKFMTSNDNSGELSDTTYTRQKNDWNSAFIRLLLFLTKTINKKLSYLAIKAYRKRSPKTIKKIKGKRICLKSNFTSQEQMQR